LPPMTTGQSVAPAEFRIDSYLEQARSLALAEIQRYVPKDSADTARLYAVMLDYPLRPAKALRPALCIATALALGGQLDGALPSAAAFELFHNAFLIHDDVEDDSALRRHGPTLHTEYGIPIAVNVGDAMLATALAPLLDNVEALGLGPALRIFRVFARMARESAEGQMLELEWMQHRRFDQRDQDYRRMVHKKTSWYSFISPVRVGAIAAGATQSTQDVLGRFALSLGVAFQIHDDLLSLEGSVAAVGKDAWGDLWEGKCTLPLLHALRNLPAAERQECETLLRRERQRPSAARVRDFDSARARELHRKIRAALPDLDPAEQRLLDASLLASEPVRDEAAVARLHELVTGRNGASLAHARRVAGRFAQRAADVLSRGLCEVPESVHKDFLRALVDFVLARTR
jgi:geranylgeranyl diphosphate synthase, type II